MGNVCFQEILLQFCLILVIHDHFYSYCLLSALTGEGMYNLFSSGRAWMKLSLEGVGWLSPLPLPIFSGLGFFILQPSFPVEFTAGGFLWVSGLIIILLGGIYLIFAQVWEVLIWFHCKTEKRQPALTQRQQILFSCHQDVREGVTGANPALRQCQCDLAVTGAAQARLLGKRKNRLTQ